MAFNYDIISRVALGISSYVIGSVVLGESFLGFQQKGDNFDLEMLAFLGLSLGVKGALIIDEVINEEKSVEAKIRSYCD